MVAGIRQIAITVSDVATAVRFYRDVLGLDSLSRPAPDLAFLDAGDVQLMLSTPQGAGRVGDNSILYFLVDDIGEAHTELVDRGAAEERPPRQTALLPDHALWTSFLRDPDGNVVGLMEERR